MDLLVEKLDGSRYYLSQYKVLITDFEESAPSVTRNSTQLDQRNGNIDFGGWHTDKTINITGYYRADDIDEEEALREKLYALLSDPEGYYITQLKTSPKASVERPGETSGGYYDKLSNYPSHKRFLVYTEAPEMELVGNVGGTLLYKLTVEFKTLKLPYGESVPRDLDVKPNVPYYGRNLALDTSNPISVQENSNAWQNIKRLHLSQNPAGLTVTFSYAVTIDRSDSGSLRMQFGSNFSPAWGMPINVDFENLQPGVKTNFHSTIVFPTFDSSTGNFNDSMLIGIVNSSALVKFEDLKVEIGNVATPWSPAPEDQEYNDWYAKTYYNTNNLFIPYAGTVPCNQLEQGFAIEFTAEDASSSLSFKIDDTELTYSGAVASGDVFLFSGFSYTQNGLSIVSKTNKAYFVLQPDKPNRITCNVPGTVRIIGFQNLYA